MSGTSEQTMRVLMLYGPVLMLWVLGLVVALRSGVVRVDTADGLRRLATNASQVALRVVLWMAGVATLLELAGSRALIRGF